MNESFVLSPLPLPLHSLSGLPSHPQHELAKKQAKGFGGMVSFRIKGESKNAKAFIKNLKVNTIASHDGHVIRILDIHACRELGRS